MLRQQVCCLVPRSSFECQAQIYAKDLAVQCPIQTLALPPSFLSLINCVGMMAVNPWNIGFGILKFGMKECVSKCSDKTSNKSNLWSIISLFPIVLSFELGSAWIRCTCRSFVHIASNQFACFSLCTECGEVPWDQKAIPLWGAMFFTRFDCYLRQAREGSWKNFAACFFSGPTHWWSCTVWQGNGKNAAKNWLWRIHDSLLSWLPNLHQAVRNTWLISWIWTSGHRDT